MNRLRTLSVPPEQIRARLNALQTKLEEKDIELALVRQNADLYYLTGTVQDAHLLVPKKGPALFLVWRCLERAREQSPIEFIEALSSLRALSDTLKARGYSQPKTVGLEMDVIPASLYLYYTQKVWPESEIIDISPIIRQVRAIKSDWEISQIKGACQQVYRVMQSIPNLIRPEMTELELASLIEKRLRSQGHPGFLRMRMWNQELGMGQILSGKQGALASWTNTPFGGIGPCPAVGMGASFKKITRSEPISIDIGGFFNGYLCDQTRLFVMSPCPGRLIELYNIVLELKMEIERRLMPGVKCQGLYQFAFDWMRSRGLEGYFMGQQGCKVRFIGHGLGIEIDEYPFIAHRSDMVIEPGMVLAIEPKLLVPDLGPVGVEDTYLITEKGAERLTLGPPDLTIID